MRLPTLYKRDQKGKIRKWDVSTSNECITVSHGLEEGKITSKITRAKAKNTGKVNEKTPESQAMLEAVSKWKAQLNRKDYHWDLELSGLQTRPVLALDYLKVPHRVNWEDAIGQNKLNGLRAIAGFKYIDDREGDLFELLTREGESWPLPNHLAKSQELFNYINSNLPPGKRCLGLDGELYIHGWLLQKLNSIAKRYQPQKSEKLEYHLFDLIIPGMSFKERHQILTDALETFNSEGPLFTIVPLIEITQETIKQQLGVAVQESYEGLMIRHLSSSYMVGGRSSDLFKYKVFDDGEFLIVDMWEDLNGNAMFTCKTPEDLTFKCTPKRPFEERHQMLKERDNYIGKWVTVKYQGFSEDLKPNFPIGLDLRDCDEDGNPLR